jgi:nucleotide-binding universal stress UspA family protein
MSADAAGGAAVLCWDGSDAARRAIRHAGRLLDADQPAVVLFAHVPPESAGGVLGGRGRPDAAVLGIAEAEAMVEDGVRVARAAGFAASGLRIVPDGRTAEAIVAAAEARDAPVIVMGQRQRSALGTLVLGSVAREVLDAFHRPVLLVGPSGAAG